MHSQNLKYSKNELFHVLIIFPFLEPDVFRQSHELHMFLRLWAVISIAFLCFQRVSKKNNIQKSSFMVPVIVIYCIWLCYVSTLSIGNLQTTITQVIPILGIVLWGDIYARQEKKICLVIKLIMMYIYINFITLILFPNGLYEVQSYQAIPYKCYFLGYRNNQSLWQLPALTLAFWEGHYSQSSYKKTKIRVATIVASILLLKSSTMYVAMFAFFILYYVFKNRSGINLWKFINAATVYVICILLSVGIIYFNIQYKFSYLIVNVLHKDLDLTDRIYLWDNIIEYIKQRPWTGYGYIYDQLSRELVGGSHAHNYSLNVLYTGGLIGFLLISIIWILSGIKSIKSMSNIRVRIIFYGIVTLLLIGLTEPLKQLPTVYLLLIILYYESEHVYLEGEK